VPEFIIPDLQVHLTNIGRSAESSALSLTLHEATTKSKTEVSQLMVKIKDE
jgi:hypothetical protein